MIESLEQYIARLKEEQQRTSPNTLEFFLKQIRELAAKGKEADEQVKSSAKVAEKVEDQTQTGKSQKQAQEEVKDSVIETTSQVNRMMIGQMVFFSYDPKGKMTLAYYDTFPLVFFFAIHGNAALGMNLHYLPPVERARLMMALMSTANSTKLDELTKLRITYKILNSSSKYRFFKPCIKKYLFSHMRSRLMVINPKQWSSVVFMPLANFQKESEYRVWNDSINIIRRASFNDRPNTSRAGDD